MADDHLQEDPTYKYAAPDADDRLQESTRAATEAFGRRMRELRAAHGVSQDDLARATDVHPTAIGRLERGAREPRLTTILRIAEGLEVRPGELLDPLMSEAARTRAGRGSSG